MTSTSAFIIDREGTFIPHSDLWSHKKVLPVSGGGGPSFMD